MRQLVYGMRFTGRATLASPDGGVLKVVTTTPSSTLTSIVVPAGLAGDLKPAAGGEAAVESEVTLTGATSFQEVGAIAFGSGHRLRFSIVGSGYLGLGLGLDPAVRHGAVTWRVEGARGNSPGQAVSSLPTSSSARISMSSTTTSACFSCHRASQSGTRDKRGACHHHVSNP